MTAAKKPSEQAQKTPDSGATARIGARRRPGAPGLCRSAPAGVEQAAGNMAVQRLLRGGAIRPKLAFNTPGDPYEQEADRVAARVISSAPMPFVQRKCAACAGGASCPKCQGEGLLQAKERAGETPDASPSALSQIAALRGGGQPLSASLRAFFEPRFGHDFGHVRVHTGGAAAETAQAIRARAYTAGHDVVFGPGEYAPETGAGKELIAHELTHVVQQSGAAWGDGGVIRRQQQPGAEPTTGTGKCHSVGVELPNRIYFSGDRGAVTATLMTTIPRGEYWITYSPMDGRFSIGSTKVRLPDNPPFTISDPSDPELFETYKESVRREGVRMHVAANVSEGETQVVPDSSIVPAYAESLNDEQLGGHADVYRTRLAHLPPGVEFESVRLNLHIIQSEQLRRQALGVEIVGESPRPFGLPPDQGFVLQPANDLPADLLANIPEGEAFTLPTDLAKDRTGSGGVAEVGPGVVSIQPLGPDLMPFNPSQPEAEGLRPTDITNPLAAVGHGLNLNMNAGLVRSGFAAAGPDAIGLVALPRWGTPGAIIPEALSDVWGHTAVYVRRGGEIQIVRGFSPQMDMSFLGQSGAVERGAAAVPSTIGDDAYLFTKTGARTIEYPVAADVAEELARRLPMAGDVVPGGNVPSLYTARPAVYQVCTASNCVLWAATEAEQALGGVIGPATRGVSVTALADEGAVIERTASQGRLINFTRNLANEPAVVPPMAQGPPVASGMPRGLQVLKWGGRAFFVIGVLTVPWEIYNAPEGQKARTAVGATAGFLGGLAAGATAGLVCGPGAPICSVVLGLVFGIAGALGARALAESIYDALVLLSDHPEALLAPPSATTLALRGGYRGLLRSPYDLQREMRRNRAAK